LGILFYIISCDTRKELLTEEVYEGPVTDMDSIFTMMSDSGKLVLTLKAPKQLDYENGDREWPNGLYIEYYTGEVPSSTFRSNYAIKKAESNLYKGEGNVIVRNLENGDELNTEELFWDPQKELFYTDKFVTIQSEGEIHTGEGLRANQDFTSYKILKPSGSLILEEEF
jgi:LPS export ABC transporter protein LptC